MRRRTVVSALACSPFAVLAAKRRSLEPTLEKQILRTMQVGPVPGLVACHVRDGKVAWIAGLGSTGGPDSKPVTADTVFQAASLTKQITAYAAFALRDQGKLDFSRTLVSYVDDLVDARARRVTIRHVLSHSSGFPNWRFEAGQALVPEFEPGERWQYSGEGYVYLQRIIEQVTGRSFFNVVDELVLEPLGMTSTALVWMPELDGRFALPHNRRGELRKDWNMGAKALHAFAERAGRSVKSLTYADSEMCAKENGGRTLPNWVLPNAAASLITTANDYARFVIAAMRNAELRSEYVKMRSGADWMLGWGLGWGLERTAVREYLWQWGDNGGFKNIVFAEARTGQAVFVFTNGDAGARVYDRIVTHVTGHDHPALFWI